MRRLFNNYALSDITLKQINKDTTREYYAHRAILCKESGFFLKAFTGTFKVGLSHLFFQSDTKVQSLIAS